MHNFYVDIQSLQKIFSEKFLNPENIPVPENFDLTNFSFCATNKVINILDIMGARDRAETWHNRYFPKTLEENKKIFVKYIKLCKEKNIIPIVTVFPVQSIYREFFPKHLLDEFYCIISEFQHVYDFHFVDKFNFDDLMKIEDFEDVDHLNSSGARKMSSFLNDYIMNLECKIN